MLLYKLMVLSPGIFIVGVGVGARTYDDPYRFIACTPVQDRNIRAYGPIATETLAVLEAGAAAPSETLRRLAQRWVDLSVQGVLKPLPPICQSDSVHQGSKAQAFRPYMLLQLRLIDRSIREREAMGPDHTADRLVLAVRLCEVMKYSDFSSLAVCSLHQKRALTHLLSLEGLSESKRLEVQRSLRDIRLSQVPLEGMIAQARINEASERVAAGQELLTPTKTRTLFTAQLASATATLDPSELDEEYPDAVNVLRIGCAAQIGFCNTLHAAEREFTGARS